MNINVPASVTLKNMLDICALVLSADQNISNQKSLLGHAVQEREGGLLPGIASMALPLPIPVIGDGYGEESQTKSKGIRDRVGTLGAARMKVPTEARGDEQTKRRKSSEITIKALLDACATRLSGQGERFVVECREE